MYNFLNYTFRINYDSCPHITDLSLKSLSDGCPVCEFIYILFLIFLPQALGLIIELF